MVALATSRAVYRERSIQWRPHSARSAGSGLHEPDEGSGTSVAPARRMSMWRLGVLVLVVSLASACGGDHATPAGEVVGFVAMADG